jgi:hypothetical protein
MIRLCWAQGLARLHVVLCLLAGCSQSAVESGLSESSASAPQGRTRTSREGDRPFWVRRAAFKTALTSPGPSPQPWEVETPPDGIREVTYPSGDLTLKAWIYVPPNGESSKHAALVFFHGGFAFGASDMLDCQPFMDAGFVVMAPWLRGENGLPGNFEMFYGELDDAVASVKWLNCQPYVDSTRIYTFGHSAGGVLSALVSLVDDVPVRFTGSSGGLYGPQVFELAEEWVPFDRSNPEERELRLLPGNLRWMKHRHYAYVGRQDGGVLGGVSAARSEMSGGSSLLEIISLPGDHFSSYPIAMQKYLELITSRP